MSAQFESGPPNADEITCISIQKKASRPAIFGQCSEGVMPAYSSGVLHWRAAEAAKVARAGDSGHR